LIIKLINKEKKRYYFTSLLFHLKLHSPSNMVSHYCKNHFERFD
jgi:hypothetical protein